MYYSVDSYIIIMVNDMTSNFKYSKDRSLGINILFCILSFLGLLLFSDILQIILNLVIKNTMICSIISNIFLIVFLYLLYLKDLNDEAKIYKKDFKKIFGTSFKYYILGFMGMIFFNILISIFLGGISSNEEQVRQMLYNAQILTLISISIIAPINEELIFRKSLDPVLKNKWVYVIVSGVLFGFAHILTNIFSGTFTPSDLFYILPYGSLGAAFALMDRETITKEEIEELVNTGKLSNTEEESLTSLREKAKEAGIKGYTKMKKVELEEALEGLEDSTK